MEGSDTLIKDRAVEEWTGNLVGRMHNARVTLDDMANELGCGKSYVSMVLNCSRSPTDAREKFEAAFDAIVSKREAEA